MIKRTITRLGFILFTLTVFNLTSNAQIVKTKYTVLDSFNKEFSNLFGQSQKRVEFKYIELENLNTSEKIRGVEMEIRTKDTEISSSSFALALSGSFWASSSSFTFNTTSESGFIFLQKDDLKEVIDFFSLATQEMGNLSDERYRVVKLSLNDSFEYGIIYKDRWSFFVSAEDAVYGLNYADGIFISKKLYEYYTEIVSLSGQDQSSE